LYSELEAHTMLATSVGRNLAQHNGLQSPLSQPRLAKGLEILSSFVLSHGAHSQKKGTFTRSCQLSLVTHGKRAERSSFSFAQTSECASVHSRDDTRVEWIWLASACMQKPCVQIVNFASSARDCFQLLA
jgi:hypothetical protein